MVVKIPVSWGELFDKLTILEIKQARIDNQQKLANINSPENCEQLKIALYPIQDFISQNANISFRKLIYLKELFKEVSSNCTQCKEQKVDCKLGCSLIYLNFNSFKYFVPGRIALRLVGVNRWQYQIQQSFRIVTGFCLKTALRPW